jgi:uncharacterized protein YbaR (Trm112 family)
MSENQPEKALNYIQMNHRYCPKCNESLKVVTTGNPVKNKSAGKSDSITGEEIVYQTQFVCLKCRLKYTIEDLRRIENSNKKKKI